MRNHTLPFLSLLAVLLFVACGDRGYTGGNTPATLTDATSSGKAARVYADSDSSLTTASEDEVNALFASLQSGEIVTLEPKRYYLDAPIELDGVDDFVLDGNGAVLILRNKDEDVLRVSSSTNVILKNFKATHVEPEGPLGCRGSVINVFYSSDIMVENCRLNGSGLIGIAAFNVKNLRATHNYIYNNSQYGILFDTDTSIDLSYNRFEDNGASGTMHLAKALDPGLTEIDQITKDQVAEGLKMSRNRFN
ncbi:MAG: right-handed parallel beta-helix repeat-containing protein [Bacteroidetes bacterium]|nr:MAG: right-handed parallel beta-helix repeat-containing protein [Bacteroidota bacterium]